ncbi:MAG: transporter substrate-binding domain-containing protein [Chlamydiota bacterium]
MSKLKDLLDQVKKIIPINKISISLMAVCTLILIWGGIRACTQAPLVPRTHLYVIARDPTWYPLNLMGKEKTVLAFTSDLLTTIAKRQNLRIELVNVSSNYLFEGLSEKEYAALISSLAPSALNNQYYNFSNPFFFVGPVLIVPADSEIESLKGMTNRIIGVRRDGNVNFNITKYNAYYKPYDSMTMAFEDLYRDRIDGIILPVLQAYTYIDTFHKGRFKVVTSPLDDQGLRLVARQTYLSDFLIEEFDTGLQEIIEDGTYQALCNKWGLINPLSIQRKNEP